MVAKTPAKLGWRKGERYRGMESPWSKSVKKKTPHKNKTNVQNKNSSSVGKILTPEYIAWLLL